MHFLWNNFQDFHFLNVTICFRVFKSNISLFKKNNNNVLNQETKKKNFFKLETRQFDRIVNTQKITFS